MDKPVQTRIDQQLEHYAEMVTQQTVTKKWEDIEVAEQAEAEFLVFPEKIWRRKRDGAWEGIACALHPLRNHEKRKARLEARKIAAREQIDVDKDPDLLNDLDTVCILWLAIRSPTAPFEPLYSTPEELERKFDRDVLRHTFGVLDKYALLLDPQLDTLNKQQFLTVLAAITEGRTIRPLLAFGGAVQVSFIITMADLLQSLTTGKLSPELFEISTPEL